jgi:Carboxypeptidase regulatory-like domain/TonB dependent receptor/TonB-dependent Receptor Plug Domain
MLLLQMTPNRRTRSAGLFPPGGPRDVARLRARIAWIAVLAVFGCASVGALQAQTAGTGAISGTVTDQSGAVVGGAKVTVTNEATGATLAVASTNRGTYTVPLLPPGSYRVDTSKQGFKVSSYPGIAVNVTETQGLNIRLQVGAVNETVQVDSAAEQLQTETSALGSVTTHEVLESLPLVTRNYTQIIGLSPGVATDVTNAAGLGRGGGSDGEEPFVANGGTSMDNNFQMDGVEINDLQGSGNFSGGVAVPNPDTIQEFKVQTGQYDASYGRNAGANVNVVTKTGTNGYHGTVFEFFRNEALNANEYFRKMNQQPRQVLRNNQFGFTFGGPVVKNKLLFFTSYQGTRQLNGVDPSCSSSFTSPPLTNDRSPAALGAVFAGQPTFIQLLTGDPTLGPTVAPDGSNISAQALALMQFKLPDGSYLIPTPQRIDPSTGLGTSSFSIPCLFNEDQFMTNGDWLQSNKSKVAARFFFANSHDSKSLPATNLGGPTSPGFPVQDGNRFRNFSLVHTYLFGSNLLNQAEFGYHSQFVNVLQKEAFSYSDVGVNAPAFDNNMPAIQIAGAMTLGGNGQSVTFDQKAFTIQDDLEWTRGRHSLRFGANLNRAEDNVPSFRFLGGLVFGTFPDFLLGQDGTTNGTGLSNVLASLDVPGLLTRQYRVWDYGLYAQDDFKVSSRLTLNLGLRFEHLGDLGDALGRNSSFDITRADPNPPVTGSLQGFVVANNFPGTIPAGVTRLDNNLALRGDGQNTWNPRLGFAWQLPPGRRMVLRGGYGVYHQRVTGQPLIQLLLNQPFGMLRQLSAFDNAAASFANPFPPGVPTFPSFTPYSPSTQFSAATFAQGFRPPILQRYSLNLQTELARDFVWEVGYVGTRGTHLIRQRSINQAGLASPSNPIRGVTTNTADSVNIAERAPLIGWTTSNTTQIESEGSSWYNALTTSLSKRFGHGLQLQAAYTFARDLTTDTFTATGANGGFAEGDQNNDRARYGPDDFIREHRFVVSYVYELPFFRNRHSVLGATLGGWKIAGVTVFQSGHRLSVFNTNAFNVFGISAFSQDFGQLGPGCTLSQVNKSGSVTSRLNNYVNASCFIDPTGLPFSPPVIGDDGVGTGFGNTRPGIIHGPDQRNTDLSLIKQFGVPWVSEAANVEFRAEFFNAFNTPQFDDPQLEQDTVSTFGTILKTVASPRIIQFALKLNF